ncbi:hypothetical protein [Lutimonas sp.]|uniref:hypothetical protein n=1 Tax=Lutimonas sp. TaxID=1872403 RepID=UPI003D9BBD53
MMEEGNMDKLIRDSLKAAQPSKGFTNNIMDQIGALESKEEKALGKVIKRSLLESPSINFTHRVMEKIETSSKALVNQPIIGKKAWIFILICLMSVVAYVFAVPSEETATSQYIDDAMTKFDGAFSFDLPSLLISPLFAISVFALSSLLFLDYFLRNRTLSLKI